MTFGRRARDWLVGRHEFRVQVEVDPEVGAARGGRPLPGSGRVEFVRVGTGSWRAAGNEVVASLREELPQAEVRALLEEPSAADPAPRLYVTKGGRPRLLLVGDETPDEVERNLAQTVTLWELPKDRYEPWPVPDPADHQRLVHAVARALPFGVPLLLVLLVVTFGPVMPGEWLLPRIFAGAPLPALGALAFALLPGVVEVLRSRSARVWPTAQPLRAATVALFPGAAVVAVSGLVDAVTWLGQRFPVAAAVLVGGGILVAAPVLVASVETPVWRAALGWGLPLLAGGIAPFAGELLLELYLGGFGLARTDVQVSFWVQWLLGSVATAACALGVYVGGAFWVLFHRFGRPSGIDPLIGLMAALIGAVYLLTMLIGIIEVVGDRARPTATGVPEPLFGLQPQRACVVPAEQPFSYVGRSAPPTDTPVIYFGRADGRLAVWSEESGGVTLDGQAVSLRFVGPGESCS